MSEIERRKKYGDDNRKIPLSNDTVARRIAEISDDQFEQLIIRLKVCNSARRNDRRIKKCTAATLRAVCRYMKKTLKKNCFFVSL